MRRTLAIIAIALMMVSAIGVAAMAYEKTGPRVDEIIMPIIKEQQARLIAFERGDTGADYGNIVRRHQAHSRTAAPWAGFHRLHVNDSRNPTKWFIEPPKSRPCMQMRIRLFEHILVGLRLS